MTTRVSFQTLGCRVNQADTIALEDEVRARDGLLVGPRDVADVYVVNTCTVTHTADADARQLVRRAKRPILKLVWWSPAATPRSLLTPYARCPGLGGRNDGKHQLIDELLPARSPPPKRRRSGACRQERRSPSDARLPKLPRTPR